MPVLSPLEGSIAIGKDFMESMEAETDSIRFSGSEKLIRNKSESRLTGWMPSLCPLTVPILVEFEVIVRSIYNCANSSVVGHAVLKGGQREYDTA